MSSLHSPLQHTPITDPRKTIIFTNGGRGETNRNGSIYCSCYPGNEALLELASFLSPPTPRAPYSHYTSHIQPFSTAPNAAQHSTAQHMSLSAQHECSSAGIPIDSHAVLRTEPGYWCRSHIIRCAGMVFGESLWYLLFWYGC